MKSKQTVDSKKQSIIVKDLKAKKNPKGGADYLIDKLHGTTGGIVQPTTNPQSAFLK
jgi:hypothetical protein